MRTLAALILLVWSGSVLGGPQVSEVSEDQSLQNVFIIRRSLNSNLLVYQGCLTADGRFCEDPIQTHWVMNTKGGTIEPLTGLERMAAYGVSIGNTTDDTVRFTLIPMTKRTLTLIKTSVEGAWHLEVRMESKGQERILKEIYIQSQGSGLFTKVKSLTLTLQDPQTGATEEETFQP